MIYWVISNPYEISFQNSDTLFPSSRNRRFCRTNQKSVIRSRVWKTNTSNTHVQKNNNQCRSVSPIRVLDSLSTFFLRLIRILIKIDDCVFQIAAYPDLVQQHSTSSQFISVFFHTIVMSTIETSPDSKNFMDSSLKIEPWSDSQQLRSSPVSSCDPRLFKTFAIESPANSDFRRIRVTDLGLPWPTHRRRAWNDDVENE